MDDLRQRFATLDAVPTELDWAEVERRAMAAGIRATTPAGVSPMPVRRASGPLVQPAANRPRGLMLLAAAVLIAALLAVAAGFGGLLTRQNAIIDVSPSPRAETTANPTDKASIAPPSSDAPTPSTAAAAPCPGLEAPQEVRITKLQLPGKTTSPLGNPLVASCALWITSGANGGGIHRVDLATGVKTNPNPAEIVWGLDTNGDQLWALGTPKAVNGGTVLYQLDPATGATLKELPVATSIGFPSEMRIVDGRAWISGYHRPLQVFDLTSGELVASVEVSGGVKVGAGGVWSGLSRIDPVTFEVTDLQTSFPANDVVVAANRLYGVDQEHGVIARLDPVSGQFLSSIQIDTWTGGSIAVERASIWILRIDEPMILPPKPVKTEILRVDATTGQIADRISIDLLAPIAFSATEGNLWLIDQPSRLRHGFFRIELPATK